MPLIDDLHRALVERFATFIRPGQTDDSLLWDSQHGKTAGVQPAWWYRWVPITSGVNKGSLHTGTLFKQPVALEALQQNIERLNTDLNANISKLGILYTLAPTQHYYIDVVENDPTSEKTGAKVIELVFTLEKEGTFYTTYKPKMSKINIFHFDNESDEVVINKYQKYFPNVTIHVQRLQRKQETLVDDLVELQVHKLSETKQNPEQEQAAFKEKFTACTITSVASDTSPSPSNRSNANSDANKDEGDTHPSTPDGLKRKPGSAARSEADGSHSSSSRRGSPVPSDNQQDIPAAPHAETVDLNPYADEAFQQAFLFNEKNNGIEGTWNHLKVYNNYIKWLITKNQDIPFKTLLWHLALINKVICLNLMKREQAEVQQSLVDTMKKHGDKENPIQAQMAIITEAAYFDNAIYEIELQRLKEHDLKQTASQAAPPRTQNEYNKLIHDDMVQAHAQSQFNKILGYHLQSIQFKARELEQQALAAAELSAGAIQALPDAAPPAAQSQPIVETPPLAKAVHFRPAPMLKPASRGMALGLVVEALYFASLFIAQSILEKSHILPVEIFAPVAAGLFLVATALYYGFFRYSERKSFHAIKSTIPAPSAVAQPAENAPEAPAPKTKWSPDKVLSFCAAAKFLVAQSLAKKYNENFSETNKSMVGFGLDYQAIADAPKKYKSDVIAANHFVKDLVGHLCSEKATKHMLLMRHDLALKPAAVNELFHDWLDPARVQTTISDAMTPARPAAGTASSDKDRSPGIVHVGSPGAVQQSITHPLAHVHMDEDYVPKTLSTHV